MGTHGILIMIGDGLLSIMGVGFIMIIMVGHGFPAMSGVLHGYLGGKVAGNMDGLH